MSSSIRKLVKEETILTGDDTTEVLRSMRDAQPTHYVLKIESFSEFLELGMEKYESDEFEADGYKWKLCLYPNGNREVNEANHISLYLAICDTSSLPKGWEVNVHFKLFVYNYMKDKYLTIQDQRVRRFSWMKTEWGFDQILHVDFFNNTSNGYLFADSCIFGAEVFVSKCPNKMQCLSVAKKSSENTYTWKIDNFSAINKETLYSEEFEVGEMKWQLELYPKGNATAKNKSLSLYLSVSNNATLPLNWRFYAKFKLLIRDQVGNNHSKKEASNWFCESRRSWGYHSFLLLDDLTHSLKGFIVNDTIIAETEIIITAVTKNLT